MTTIDDVLQQIADHSQNEQEKGFIFERLMVSFLKTDPTYCLQFSNVWRWQDWPDNKNEPEIGCDLVAENADGSGFTAIQCKNYALTTSLDKDDLNSFYERLGLEPFTHGIIIATTNLWSPNAKKTLTSDRSKPVRWISREDLASSKIDWSQWDIKKLEKLVKKSPRTPDPHQKIAIEDTLDGFAENDRGKLIMACGTGKTYTAQCIAEDMVGRGGNVLVLVPSISLLSQTLKEWTSHASIPIAPYAICSDVKAGQKRKTEDISPYDLAIPATTDKELLLSQYKRSSNKETMSVFFSTYQSINVLTEAQNGKTSIPEFDLIISDEAHRTTGVTLAGEKDSNFTKVHDDAYVKAKKRLYMTATPRMFGDVAKGKAAAADAWLASMDDEEVYGPEFHRLRFYEAVEQKLLTDYKVLILTVDEEAVSAAFQQQLADEDHELELDNATRIVGCVNALAKQHRDGITFTQEESPMSRAVAFSNTIENSKTFQNLFNEVSNQWQMVASSTDQFEVDVKHVDGTFNSMEREDLLHWLKEGITENECHVLSNAKCLTEGVDVPSLDAIMFLEPRNSMIDVVQAVGRVMRKHEGKELGYIILPVGIPAGEDAKTVLDNNKRWKQIWEVVNAIRSHDERLNAVINKLDLNDELPEMIEVVPVGLPGDEGADSKEEKEQIRQLALSFPFEEIRENIFVKMVSKVGTRDYLERWSKDVADIALKHEKKIKALVEDKTLGLKKHFEHFVEGLQAIINGSITSDRAVGMLSQHLITKPIFDVLFEDYDFASSNPVSKKMQNMVDLLDEHSLDKETESLEGFYESVRLRVEGVDNAAGKQRIINELYEGFFRNVFPKESDSLGVVYTPIELVDFALYAADHALHKHFDGTSLTDKGIDVLDPFCGTGTFIVRLLQSGIIKPEDYVRKYQKELHSNELLILAYYIAAINIESTYHDQVLKEKESTDYVPFNGIVLTDTFQMGESGEGTGVIDVFPENNERAEHQKKTTIEVVVGNPPYSASQESQNDDNQNLSYKRLDASIAKTYASLSTAQLQQNLYDSYTRAFRRASDIVLSVEGGGVISFVTNGSFIDGLSFDGFRKTLASEFHHIYIYNLRGNQRTAGEESRKEGGKVFGSGSRATIAITILVKEPGVVSKNGATIHYKDIGDYLTREEKLEIVQNAADSNALDNITWETITPNKDGDWIGQRSETYKEFLKLYDRNVKDKKPQVFSLRSNGVLTSRDAWNYNSSKSKLKSNTKKVTSFYNQQMSEFHKKYPKLSDEKANAIETLKSFLDLDPKKMKWDRSDFGRLIRKVPLEMEDKHFYISQYRPFFKQYVNFGKKFNNMIYQLPKLFPDSSIENLTICTIDKGSPVPDFSTLMIKHAPEYHLFGTGDSTKLFSQYIFEGSTEDDSLSLFDSQTEIQTHNVTDEACEYFRSLYDQDLSKDDIFFYIYGIFHSPDFRKTFQADLKKEDPRVPAVKSSELFQHFSKAGRELSDLHTNYENAEPWPELNIEYSDDWNPKLPNAYLIDKMRYSRKGKKTDKSIVIYNSYITISNIPDAVHDYRLGANSALDWILERYQVKTHKASGIVNNPNDWVDEHDDPTYIFDLIRRIVTVSMKTNEIVAGLPKLKF